MRILRIKYEDCGEEGLNSFSNRVTKAKHEGGKGTTDANKAVGLSKRLATYLSCSPILKTCPLIRIADLILHVCICLCGSNNEPPVEDLVRVVLLLESLQFRIIIAEEFLASVNSLLGGRLDNDITSLRNVSR